MKKKLVFAAAVFSFALFMSGPAGIAQGGDEGIEHGGDIIYTKPVKAVIFSHKAHTEDIGLHCEWCHEKTFEMEALKMQEQADNTMESLCNEKYCGVCHNGDISFSTTTQCARCHIGVTGYNELVRKGKIKADTGKTLPPAINETGAEKNITEPDVEISESAPAGDAKTEKSAAMKNMVEAGYYPENISIKSRQGRPPALFNHRTHTEREQQRCIECHPKIFKMKILENFGEKNMPAQAKMEKGKYCGVCHNGEKAFSVSDSTNCNKCHYVK